MSLSEKLSDWFGSKMPAEADLESINTEGNARYNQNYTLVYSVDEGCQVNLDDLAKGAELGIPEIPLNGFEPHEVLGRTVLDK